MVDQGNKYMRVEKLKEKMETFTKGTKIFTTYGWWRINIWTKLVISSQYTGQDLGRI